LPKQYTTNELDEPVYEAPPGDLPRKAQDLINESLGGAKSLTMGFFIIPKGGHSKLDTHPGVEEAYYVTQGSGYTVIDDQRCEISRGTAVFIPAGAKHQSFNTGNEDLRLLYFFPRAMGPLGHKREKWPVSKS